MNLIQCSSTTTTGIQCDALARAAEMLIQALDSNITGPPKFSKKFCSTSIFPQLLLIS